MTLDFIHVAAFIILFGFFWRLLAARMAGTTLGQAMSFIY